MVKNTVFLLFLVALAFECSEGVVYKIGDEVGWTPIGNVDYNNWASSKTFLVGDTIVFEYDPLYHNVLQLMSLESFRSCDTTSPVATYATGNDSITIKSHGHYYFICGSVGHCEAGQKVDIRVPKSVVQPTISPAESPVEPPQDLAVPVASSTGPFAPSPAPNSGESVLSCNRFSGVSWLLMTIVLVLMC